MADASVQIRGARLVRGYLDHAAQESIVADLRELVAKAPLFRPVTSRGQQMSVRMTSAGRFGWVSDRRGYRYEPVHPVTGQPWPEIPDQIASVWSALCSEARPAECCLVNYYDASARMGMHQDADEADMAQPVLSISLGDDALFRLGNDTRGGKTESIWLKSGDVVVLEGASRRLFHGVDRIKGGTSDLLSTPGRINLTLRVVT